MLGTTRESWWHVVLLTARHYWSTWPCALNLNLLTSCCSMWTLRCKEPKIRSWVRQWISWITCLATCAVNSVNSSHAGETLSWVVLSNFSNFHFKFWKFDYRGNMGWRVFLMLLCHISAIQCKSWNWGILWGCFDGFDGGREPLADHWVVFPSGHLLKIFWTDSR